MTTKSDIYATVTNQIIADLEKGSLTWLQPWQADHALGPICRPLRSCGTAYKGINIIMLWASAAMQQFDNPVWVTYKQAAELGGHIRKGEKGTQVVYADQIKRTDTNAEGKEVESSIPFMKCYTVFNAQQTEGLPQRFYASLEPVQNEVLPLETVERFFRATGAVIAHGGAGAFYAPARDLVQMPERSTFRDAESYYATLGHEVTHWTAHPSRLARDLGGKRFGDAGYAMEELVAEIGAAFLCADLGITPETRQDHAAYIATWLIVLRQDKRAIFTAAAHAQKAVDYLHACQP